MKKISIVVPVYNEEFFIRGLLESFAQVKYPKEDFEVNVVCDGCTDGTVAVVKQFSFVRLIELKENVGRYAARKIGAEAATYADILYIDSRCELDPNILSAIDKSKAKVIIGRIVTDKKAGMFETFYMSVRRVVFSNYFRNTEKPIELNKENFDTLPKGTTVLYIQKGILYQAFNDLSHLEMGKNSSDDTKLLRAVVDRTPIILNPDVKIFYYYRKSFVANLTHLYDFIASSFVDYYLTPTQKYFWLIIVLPIIIQLAILLWLLFSPFDHLTKLSTIVGIDLAITLFLAKTFRELCIIAFMLPVCVIAFYLGVMRGVWHKNIGKSIREL